MAIEVDRSRVSEGISRCREAKAVLLATSAGLRGLGDQSTQELVFSSLETVARLEARLQLLGQAYEIAERDWASPLPPGPEPDLALEVGSLVSTG